MLRVTKDNLRHENKTSQTIILHTPSTTRISTNIPQLMIRCPRESGLRILTNTRSGFTIRDVQKYFHRILFHLVLILSLSYLMATKRQADLRQNSQKFFSLKLWLTEKKRKKNFHKVIFRCVLWSSSIKLSERSPLT